VIAERALRGAEDAGKKVTLTCGAGVAARGKGDARAGAGWGQAQGWAGGACALRWLASGAGGEGGEVGLRGVREDRAQVGSRAAR